MPAYGCRYLSMNIFGEAFDENRRCKDASAGVDDIILPTPSQILVRQLRLAYHACVHRCFAWSLSGQGRKNKVSQRCQCVPARRANTPALPKSMSPSVMMHCLCGN